MHKLEAIITSIDYTLDTRRKKHITGGILLSVSMFLGGLAATVITLKMEEKEKEADKGEQYLE